MLHIPKHCGTSSSISLSPLRQRSLPIRMDNTLWTNYHSPRRQRKTLPLQPRDSQGPFSIGVLTLMDTQTTPSCLRIRILCRHPFAFLPEAQGAGGTIGFMGAVGYHLVRSPCLCLYFVSWSWWSLRGRGIISDSCQPSALFGIMFLLGVILRLQKSCCLYSEKQGGGGWRWVAGFAPAALKTAKKKKKSFRYTCLNPHVCKKCENY